MPHAREIAMLLPCRMLALLLVTLSTLAASTPAPTIVGTWTLVSATSTDENGKGARSPYGAHPTGMLIYNADGSMSAVISYEGRKPLSIVDREGAPASERAEAFASFLAYAGHYTVAGDRVTHHVEVGSVQNWVGTDLVRRLQVDGDRLALRTPPTRVGGQRLIVELVWQRARAD
jgi:hypothetical protein